MRHVNLTLRLSLVVATCVFVLGATWAEAACPEPRYRTGRDFSNGQLGLVALHVAVDQADLSVESLVCLGESLRARNTHWRRGSVLVFGSLSAARDFVGGTVEVPFEGRASTPREQAVIDAFWESQRQLRATYAFDAEKSQQSLTISPFGAVGAEYGAEWDTTFQLPLRGPARCRLELGGRCVMSIGRLREYPIPYPADALRARLSGSVVVTATITRAGAITGARTSSGAHAASLANAALANLGTWVLEPGARDQRVEVTYSYEIDSSLGGDSQPLGGRQFVRAPEGNLQVAFELPHVTIRGFPRAGAE